MTKRFPRPEPVTVKRFPRNTMSKNFTSEELEEATKKNGSVDLSKIRQVVSRRSKERKESAQKALETKKEHNEVFARFMNAYKMYMNAEFIPKTKERFVSYNQNGKRIARRYKTDRARFVDFYMKVKKRYETEYWEDRWAGYIDRAFELALEEYQFSEQTKIFGVIISEKVAEKVFTDLRRTERRKQRRTKRQEQRNRHARLFNRK
ncbi:MAG: hypothetical protein ACTSW7_01275 [Candidatus Thorarchaeota archaeon]|nr:hypothetical protein [Thermoplasmatales archaeon]